MNGLVKLAGPTTPATRVGAKEAEQSKWVSRVCGIIAGIDIGLVGRVDQRVNRQELLRHRVVVAVY
jgi:hypothetical protein